MFRIKNIVGIVSSTLIAFSFNTFSLPASSIAVTDNISNPHSIGGIRMKMNESQVQHLLGKPLHRSTGNLVCGDNRFISLTYSQGEVILEETGKDKKFRAITIKTNSRNWKTEKGVRVGNNISKAKTFYSLQKNGNQWQVQRPINSPGILRFTTDHNQEIIEIDIVWDYGC
jgi:hypothetical protein